VAAVLFAIGAVASADTVATTGTTGAATTGTGSDPMPPEDADAAAKLDPKNMQTLTDDPVLGKAHAISGEEHPGLVAFTFDDGPNPDTSPIVIDALDKYDIPATFFIITQNITGKSKRAEAARAALARELASGYTVGSHSVTHPNLKTADGDTLDREIDGSIKTLAMTAHRPIGLFRPPYGSLSGAGRMRLKKLGVTEVQWSIDTLDWKAKDADRLRKKTVKMIFDQNGGVVLMHDRVRLTSQIIAGVFDDVEAENCRRLADGKEPIWPVSLHYFLKDGKTPRAIPADIEARTKAYQAAFAGRCHLRDDMGGNDGSGSAGK
jgi:peptidoglycan/xylan/chitin deacetylase (PgdA/CDA1 family)